MTQRPLEFLSQERFQAVRPGLDRVRELLARLGDPQKKLKTVHVAGTNGKGSVCACIASVLRHAGYTVGMYTSPSVVCYNERYQINGKYISDGELVKEMEKLEPVIDAMEDTPSQFEIETALAFDYFLGAGCDISVIEVGMGGRWDATNVIDSPEAAVICAIGLDHCGMLGNTAAGIARVKAGIIKPGCDAVLYPSGEEPDAEVEKQCALTGAVLHRCVLDGLKIFSSGVDGSRFDFDGLDGIYIPLPGKYQPKNAALAVTALRALRSRGWEISDEDIKNGLAETVWPGRMELLSRRPAFILDGSHNPHGMKATAESLREYFPGRKLVYVVSMMADKDVAGTLELLVPTAELFVAVEAPNSRAMKPGELAKLVRSMGAKAAAFDRIDTGVRYALERAGKDGAVAALGTLYFSS
ncbi:MAG: bifunctional folylpolyglutamate synthase/dihydrofolate synthase, partial [Oscillospiraceae bacterium]|nr:bifunctional folylpolyglutamate synthase/dihydrofolate synthase [Oscillospiraceae bacterium]